MDVWDIVWVVVRILLAIYLVFGFFFYLKAQSAAAQEQVDGKPGSSGASGTARSGSRSCSPSRST